LSVPVIPVKQYGEMQYFFFLIFPVHADRGGMSITDRLDHLMLYIIVIH